MGASTFTICNQPYTKGAGANYPTHILQELDTLIEWNECTLVKQARIHTHPLFYSIITINGIFIAETSTNSSWLWMALNDLAL